MKMNISYEPPIDLHQSYSWANRSRMEAQEVADVRRSSGWVNLETAAVERDLRTAMAVVGAREEATGLLVAVGDIFEVEPATLADSRRRYAYLGFVGVHPKHRRKGLAE